MANEPTQRSDRVARLVMQLNAARINPRCSACGHDQWDYGHAVTTLGEELEVLALVCTNCGHVRFHSAQHIENRAQGY